MGATTVAVLCVLLVASPHRIAAQDLVVDTLAAPQSHGVFGTPANRRRAILALWALHPFDAQFPEFDWTRGLGLQFGQWFGATFVNSYQSRSFIGGIERYWVSRSNGFLAGGLGYRVGLVTGYDERLMPMAGHVPILPFGGFLAWADVGPIGIDVFYVLRAMTVEGSVRF